jgi:hypothetical protein
VESILAEEDFFLTCAPGEIDYSSADVELFQTKNYRVRLFLTLHKEERKAIILFALYCFPCKRTEKRLITGAERVEAAAGGTRNALCIIENAKKEGDAAAVS